MSYSLKKRLKLFDATITESVLWAAESWAPRAAELRRLQATQSAVLRHLVGCGRQEGEQWADRSSVLFAEHGNMRAKPALKNGHKNISGESASVLRELRHREVQLGLRR